MTPWQKKAKKYPFITGPRNRAEYEAFLAEQEVEDPVHYARLKRRDQSEAPLLNELAVLGYDLITVGELAGTQEIRADVLEVMSRHLDEDWDDVDRTWLVRCFAADCAAPYWERLKALYLSLDSTINRMTKDGLAAAMAEIVETNDDLHLDELIRLVQDPSNGPSRLHFVHALEHSRNPAAEPALAEVDGDAELQGHHFFGVGGGDAAHRVTMPKQPERRKSVKRG